VGAAVAAAYQVHSAQHPREKVVKGHAVVRLARTAALVVDAAVRADVAVPAVIVCQPDDLHLRRGFRFPPCAETCLMDPLSATQVHSDFGYQRHIHTSRRGDTTARLWVQHSATHGSVDTAAVCCRTLLLLLLLLGLLLLASLIVDDFIESS
jgi:hypothetical protein